MERLAADHDVTGRLPEWRICNPTPDISEAMRWCAADLHDLDPCLVEILDFSAVAARSPGSTTEIVSAACTSPDTIA